MENINERIKKDDLNININDLIDENNDLRDVIVAQVEEMNELHEQIKVLQTKLETINY